MGVNIRVRALATCVLMPLSLLGCGEILEVPVGETEGTDTTTAGAEADTAAASAGADESTTHVSTSLDNDDNSGSTPSPGESGGDGSGTGTFGDWTPYCSNAVFTEDDDVIVEIEVEDAGAATDVEIGVRGQVANGAAIHVTVSHDQTEVTVLDTVACETSYNITLADTADAMLCAELRSEEPQTRALPAMELGPLIDGGADGTWRLVAAGGQDPRGNRISAIENFCVFVQTAR